MRPLARHPVRTRLTRNRVVGYRFSVVRDESFIKHPTNNGARRTVNLLGCPPFAPRDPLASGHYLIHSTQAPAIIK